MQKKTGRTKTASTRTPSGRTGEKKPAARSGRAASAKPAAGAARRTDARGGKPAAYGGRGAGKPAARPAEKTYRGRDRAVSRAQEPAQIPDNLIIGRNPVTEALKAGRTIDKVLIQKDAEGSAKKIASLARERKLLVQYVDRLVLDRLCPGRPHQGVAAYAAAHSYSSIDAILESAALRGEQAFVVVLDGLEDPHNLGAVLRSCDGAGAHGVIIPARRAVGLTETVAKASAGAIEYIPVAKVPNIAAAVEELKERGLWAVAVDMDGENYADAPLDGPIALVIGGEGQGVSRLVREKCDRIVSIPMKGRVNSLNASNAAAILLYEVVRRRDGSAE